ncbi:MAG: phosphoribosylglycinamide formyltransferase [Caldilineaceae bacterium]|nr:phosphoribosylglycinamide formyltransferase [Caldilineaceae bacterium]
MTATLAVLISGNGSNLQAIIDAIAGGRLDARIAVVVSNRKDAFGLIRAERAGIPTRYHPLKPYRDQGKGRCEYDGDLAALLAEFRPDWIVLAGWMHIFSNAFLDHFPHRVVNLHPALPGQFPGARAIEDALAAFHRGEIRETGVMVHLVPDERVDEGPVLATRTIPIRADDTLERLSTRIHAVEHVLLVETLQGLIKKVSNENTGEGD